MPALRLFILTLRGFFASRSRLLLENLALRQQLAVLSRQRKRPRVQNRDRLFWILLSRLFQDWRSCLLFVKPETVVKWHRGGFRQYWRWKSRVRRPGRPAIDTEVRAAIRQLLDENALWGAPRIHGELLKLGYQVSERTVGRYLKRIRPRRTSSQSWMTFLRNHLGCTAACDFFVVPTATFRVLYCFLVMTHERRRVVHFHVTTNPTARWAAQQLIEAFPGDGTEPKYLIRDNDGIYGDYFVRRVAGMEIEEKRTAPRSPWQNPFCERVIGSVRRECLDHLIILSESHLRHILHEYFRYYHESRTHLSLGKDAPTPRTLAPGQGHLVATPILGGLHHSYRRAA